MKLSGFINNNHRLFAALLFFCMVSVSFAARVRPRVIATTDGEIDDLSTMVRFLMYSCDYEVVGIIQNNSRYQKSGHSKDRADHLNPKGTYKGAWFPVMIDGYKKVYPQLIKHNPDYPTAEYLTSVMRIGNENPSDLYVEPAKMQTKNTEGERLIVKILTDEDPREVHISCWGGSNTVASALYTIKYSGKYSEDQIKKALAKVRIYCIWYQDGGGKWIDTNVKEAFIFEAYRWENIWDYQSYDGSFKGRPSSNPKDVQEYMKPVWLNSNVRENHGALGTLTPQHWISEGDTPSWLHLVNNGLESHTDYTIGGWGGRGVYDDKAKKPNHITDKRLKEDGDANKHYWRWVIAAQNDFAARADWCVKDYDKANHAPVAAFNGSTVDDFPIVKIDAMPGQTINLDATGSKDPDNNALSYKWWVYKEIGSYGKDIGIKYATSQKATITIPADAAGKTIHVLLEVTDNGEPPLKGWRRAIVNIKAN